MATTNGYPPRKFPVGAVVKLNSGSPRLTVTGHVSSEGNDVSWITGSYGDARRATYPDAAIYLAAPRWRAPLIGALMACGSLLAFIAGHAAFVH